MRHIFLLFLIAAVVVSGIVPTAARADNPSGYLVLKGGLYSPSKSFDLDTVHFDTKDGFVVAGALGHYILPFLAVEVEGGYFESKTNASVAGAASKLRVYPVVATGKLLIPAGPIEPYGEFGVGMYIIDLDISGTPGNFTGSTKGTFGYHAGGGVNLNIGPAVFVGAEGRYLWATQSFGNAGQDIKLDGFTVTGNLGFRF